MKADVTLKEYNLNSVSRNDSTYLTRTKVFNRMTEYTHTINSNGLYNKHVLVFKRVSSETNAVHTVGIDVDTGELVDRHILAINTIVNKHINNPTTKLNIEIRSYYFNGKVICYYIKIVVIDAFAKYHSKAYEFGLCNFRSSGHFKFFNLTHYKILKDNGKRFYSLKDAFGVEYQCSDKLSELIKKANQLTKVNEIYPNFFKNTLIEHFFNELKVWLKLYTKTTPSIKTKYNYKNFDRDIALIIFKTILDRYPELSNSQFDYVRFTTLYSIFVNRFLNSRFFKLVNILCDDTYGYFGSMTNIPFSIYYKERGGDEYFLYDGNPNSKTYKKKVSRDILYYFIWVYRTVLYYGIMAEYAQDEPQDKRCIKDLKLIDKLILFQHLETNKLGLGNKRWKTNNLKTRLNGKDVYNKVTITLRNIITLIGDSKYKTAINQVEEVLNLLINNGKK